MSLIWQPSGTKEVPWRDASDLCAPINCTGYRLAWQIDLSPGIFASGVDERAWKMLCHNYLMALAVACEPLCVPIYSSGRKCAKPNHLWCAPDFLYIARGIKKMHRPQPPSWEMVWNCVKYDIFSCWFDLLLSHNNSHREWKYSLVVGIVWKCNRSSWWPINIEAARLFSQE